MDSFIKEANVYGWLASHTCEMKRFNFVGPEMMRSFSKLDSLWENSLDKYMSPATEAVEDNLKQILTERFVLVIDGWTKFSAVFLGVFAPFTSSKVKNCYKRSLLPCSLLQIETRFSAQEQKISIELVLQLYGKMFYNLVGLCCDNVEVNGTLALLCNLPFSDCNSHRFNLAVVEGLNEQMQVMEKKFLLMLKLKVLKRFGKVHQLTLLPHIQKNELRWLSKIQLREPYFSTRGAFVGRKSSQIKK